MQGTRILLLEDDRETRWTLATVLRREGCRVTEASDGEEGLRLLARSAFELCISDVCMPGMGGFGFFAAVRFGDDAALASMRSVPVMLISGQVPRRDLSKALDAGVDDVMEKPLDPDEFKARVRAVLRRARASTPPSTRTSGDLADFSAAAIAQALHLGGRSTRVRLVSGAVSATLDFQRGEIVHALHDGVGGQMRGDAAAIEALSLQRGTFEILPVQESTPRTVFADTTSLVLRAATNSDEIALQVQLGIMPAEGGAA